MRSSLASVLSAAGVAGRVLAAVPLSPSSPQPATAVAAAIVRAIPMSVDLLMLSSLLESALSALSARDAPTSSRAQTRFLRRSRPWAAALKTATNSALAVIDPSMESSATGPPGTRRCRRAAPQAANGGGRPGRDRDGEAGHHAGCRRRAVGGVERLEVLDGHVGRDQCGREHRAGQGGVHREELGPRPRRHPSLCTLAT